MSMKTITWKETVSYKEVANMQCVVTLCYHNIKTFSRPELISSKKNLKKCYEEIIMLYLQENVYDVHT